ncbi:UNVERIFIED_CONTAM: hypothetical protein Sradi_6116500 [Sesamum radiatum]|uniref:Retroviral polymerase SH3-like domain-containing protein n=1 Tax=Sesamum radiatum TaxID=300843 RepID=A0AAW2KJ18_SESRA
MPHKSKFTKRAHICIFLGYALGQKGYKLYDMDEKMVLISRDVFHETLFLYENAPASKSDCSLLIPVLNEDTVTLHTIPVLIPSSSPDHVDFPLPDIPSVDGFLAPTLRRSSRQITKPCWLNDFVRSSTHFGSGPPTVTSIAPSHSAFTASISMLHEPKTYQKASSSPEWKTVMKA